MATVLLVDDEPGIREVLRLYAEAGGLTVVGEAMDGRKAVDLAARLKPDVIVLDDDMPKMTGLEALPRLRRRLPLAVIVIYTGGSATTQADALARGATAYLTKSGSPKTVIRTILELVSSRPPVAT